MSPTDPAPAGSNDPSYDELVAQALSAPFVGWDFSWLRSRTRSGTLSWSYADLARAAIADSRLRVLDIDTGGGELLGGLAPLPRHTVATEAWPPNVPVARRRLEPLGVEVRQPGGDRLPVADGEFDLVLNRHGALDLDEIWRALAPGGLLLTQQVGSRNDLELHEVLGEPPAEHAGFGTCTQALDALTARGFRVLDSREEMPEYEFYDVGAVVFQLRAVSWTVPHVEVERYDRQLRALHDRIRTCGSFLTHDHRYVIRARKPS